MARLIVWLGAVLVAAAQAGPARGAGSWRAEVAEASARFGIPVAWIDRVIAAESGGRTTLGGRPIRSRAGAMGLMQLMPGTWRAMRQAHALGVDPDDPRDNILAGTAYLRAMYDRFGYPGLFAAYNAGPARYADHLDRGTRLPAETVGYLAKVADIGVVRSQRSGPAPVGDHHASPLLAHPAAAATGSAGATRGSARTSELFFRLRER